MPDANISINEYISIIKKRKWFILEFVILVMLITGFVLYASFEEISATSSARVAFSNSDVGYLQNSEMIVEFSSPSTAIVPIKQKVGQDERLLSMFDLVSRGGSPEEALANNDRAIERFISILGPEQNANLKYIDDKLQVYEEANQRVSKYIEDMNIVLYDSLNNSAETLVLIDKFEDQIELFRGGLSDDEIKGQNIDLFVLYKTKLSNDIRRIRDSIIKGQGTGYSEEERELRANSLLKELEDLEREYNSYFANETDRYQLIVSQFSALQALAEYRNSVLSDHGKRVANDNDFNSEPSSVSYTSSLLAQNKKYIESSIKEINLKRQIEIINNSYNYIQGPYLRRNSFPSTAVSIISVGKEIVAENQNVRERERVEDLAYAMKTIPTEIILREIIDEYYPEESLDDFVNRHLRVELIESRKSPREVVALSFIKITTFAENENKSLELNSRIVDSFRNYKSKEAGYDLLIESKQHQLESFESLKKSVDIDVQIFEQSLFERNYVRLKEIPITRLRLLITSYSQYNAELVDQKNALLLQKADVGDIKVLSYPRLQSVRDARTNKEKLTMMFFAFIGSIVGGIFLVVQYEKNWPEYRKSIEQYLGGFGITLNHKSDSPIPSHASHHQTQNPNHEIDIINAEVNELYRKVVHK